MAWFHKRLRDAVAERHPSAFHTINSMTRPLPRSQRALHSRTRYEILRDPVIDRHIRNLDRVQIPLQYAMLGFFAVVLILVVVSAVKR
jgi:hypothetical protein